MNNADGESSPERGMLGLLQRFPVSAPLTLRSGNSVPPRSSNGARHPVPPRGESSLLPPNVEGVRPPPTRWRSLEGRFPRAEGAARGGRRRGEAAGLGVVLAQEEEGFAKVALAGEGEAAAASAWMRAGPHRAAFHLVFILSSRVFFFFSIFG